MPIEQVRCDNCGSGDVRQSAADSYVCEHCHTNFRWVDPTKRTVVQKASVCKCGHVAAAYCVGCGEPICESHVQWQDQKLLSEMTVEEEYQWASWIRNRRRGVPQGGPPGGRALCGECNSKRGHVSR
ncbi:MAG: hypothetical protein ACLQNE_45540 [Thermoguttaceae bacterium]